MKKTLKLNESKLKNIIETSIKNVLKEGKDMYDMYDDEYNDFQEFNNKLVNIIQQLENFSEEYPQHENGHIQNAIDELNTLIDEATVSFM